MQTYSVAVALFDFIPVAVSAAGLYFLACGIHERHRDVAEVAWLATVLIPLGGLCKASWKLIVALTGTRIALLDNLLFILLAPGFVAMAFALHHARVAWQKGIYPNAAYYYQSNLLAWLALPLGGALLAGLVAPNPRAWYFWLLACTGIATLVLIVQAIVAVQFSRAGKLAFFSLLVGAAATIAMGTTARLPPGEATAWIQEGVNLTAQLAMALGFYRLSLRMRYGAGKEGIPT